MPDPITIVIPGDDPAQFQGTPQLDRLRALGRVVLFTDRPTTAEEKVLRASGASVLVNSRSAVKWPGTVLRALPDLRLIALCGIGTDAVDLAAARELGVAVCNVPGRTAPIVAEHAVALMFAVARRAWYQTNELKSGRWTRRDNVYLRGKTLGVVGVGPIGAEVARLGRAVGMRVVAWAFRPTQVRAAELGVTFLPLADLLRAADVVSLHVKLTEQTRRLIGEGELALMKPGALLVNTARGAVVDEAALAAALSAGRLGGAGIDVYETEPLTAESPLLRCEQVVLTPHNADQTPEGTDFLNDGVVENVTAFLEGRPQNCVL
jgi:D-3-phosphoglycerate dehydrogenase